MNMFFNRLKSQADSPDKFETHWVKVWVISETLCGTMSRPDKLFGSPCATVLTLKTRVWGTFPSWLSQCHKVPNACCESQNCCIRWARQFIWSIHGPRQGFWDHPDLYPMCPKLVRRVSLRVQTIEKKPQVIQKSSNVPVLMADMTSMMQQEQCQSYLRCQTWCPTWHRQLGNMPKSHFISLNRRSKSAKHIIWSIHGPGQGFWIIQTKSQGVRNLSGEPSFEFRRLKKLSQAVRKWYKVPGLVPKTTETMCQVVFKMSRIPETRWPTWKRKNLKVVRYCLSCNARGLGDQKQMAICFSLTKANCSANFRCPEVSTQKIFLKKISWNDPNGLFRIQNK